METSFLTIASRSHFTRRSSSTPRDFGFLVAVSILTPLQGFWNAFVHFRYKNASATNHASSKEGEHIEEGCQTNDTTGERRISSDTLENIDLGQPTEEMRALDLPQPLTINEAELT